MNQEQSSPQAKADQTPSKDGAAIAAMFNSIAPRYDLMNRVMTMWQDQKWRRFVVRQADIKPGQHILDLASGTGDIAFEALRQCPGARVVAADFSEGMMAQGRLRKDGELLKWVVCDAMDMPFEDKSFDAVVFGYLLRNVADVDRTLQEIKRVLKPGGRIVCLDTTPPPPGLLQPVLNLYLRYGLPLLGRLLAGNTGSYAYLSQSTMTFEDPLSLKRIFEQNGFHNVAYRCFMFKTIAVHWAGKPR